LSTTTPAKPAKAAPTTTLQQRVADLAGAHGLPKKTTKPVPNGLVAEVMSLRRSARGAA
jgi:hypothetical protein